MIALLVCLIPTTIGALLAAIGIAGMDRALTANIIAKSGKAVEVAGDVDTLLLDKTGTITIGNRRATAVRAAAGHDRARAGAAGRRWRRWPTRRRKARASSSWRAPRLCRRAAKRPDGSRFIEFTAQTRMSGIDLPGGCAIRKGAQHDRPGRPGSGRDDSRRLPADRRRDRLEGGDAAGRR